MFADLSEDQKALALAMSDISESAYSAGWMDGLEYALWYFLTTGKRKYGRSCVTDEEVDRLRALSERTGGWITYDDQKQETFISSADWSQVYANGIPTHLRFIEEGSEG